MYSNGTMVLYSTVNGNVKRLISTKKLFLVPWPGWGGTRLDASPNTVYKCNASWTCTFKFGAPQACSRRCATRNRSVNCGYQRLTTVEDCWEQLLSKEEVGTVKTLEQWLIRCENGIFCLLGGSLQSGLPKNCKKSHDVRVLCPGQLLIQSFLKMLEKFSFRMFLICV